VHAGEWACMHGQWRACMRACMRACVEGMCRVCVRACMHGGQGVCMGGGQVEVPSCHPCKHPMHGTLPSWHIHQHGWWMAWCACVHGWEHGRQMGMEWKQKKKKITLDMYVTLPHHTDTCQVLGLCPLNYLYILNE